MTGCQVLTDEVITYFCEKIGVKLLPVDKYTIPKFRLSLQTINYALLISKALFIQRTYEGYKETYESRKERNRRWDQEREREQEHQSPIE